MNKRPGLALAGSAAAALLLTVFALAGAALVTFTETSTRERIASNERAARLAMLNDLVPVGQYDNDFFSDTVQVSNSDLLGTAMPVTVYRATLNGQPVAAVINAVAPNGYTGPIHLAIGILADGTLAGVRVTSHKETPGLGDAITLDKSNWILGFDGRSVTDPEAASWALKKNGGIFDAFTGASITPRAIVQAVHSALLYFDAHAHEIFAQLEPPTPASPDIAQ